MSRLARAKAMQRQFGKIGDDALLHDSSSGVPLGQNQPISAIATGMEPQTTAHGVKIDQISITLVAIAVQKRPDRIARRSFARLRVALRRPS